MRHTAKFNGHQERKQQSDLTTARQTTQAHSTAPRHKGTSQIVVVVVIMLLLTDSAPLCTPEKRNGSLNFAARKTEDAVVAASTAVFITILLGK